MSSANGSVVITAKGNGNVFQNVHAAASASAAAANDTKASALVGASAAASKGRPCPHSCSNWKEIVTRDVELSLAIDFRKRMLVGHVDLHMEVVAGVGMPATVQLDCKQLAIHRVLLLTRTETKWQEGVPLDFTLPSHSASLGHTLVVQLSKTKASSTVVSAAAAAAATDTKADSSAGTGGTAAAAAAGVNVNAISIRIYYNTTPLSGGIQWLSAEQTGTKKHPFMFTQCEAILARTLLPCQDTPAVKAPVTMRLACPLGLVALGSGSAVSTHFNDDGDMTIFEYRQPIAVPSYLIAIVAGDLVPAKIGPRSTVWAERNNIRKAVWEFSADTEQYVAAAEKVTGVPYKWLTYNMVILPRSFPYGGMENPQLTFLNASLLAGDRSLTNVNAHEICHSWAGNLMTNARWSDFWVNEGFDVYIERLVLGHVYGRKVRDFEILCGYQDLIKTVAELEAGGHHEWTKLSPNNPDDEDPDESFSKIPYEKGSLFLLRLECLLHEIAGRYQNDGAAGMQAWLKSLYTTFADRSVTVEQVRDHFLAFFAKEGQFPASNGVILELGQMWTQWLTTAGMPPWNPNDSKLIDRSIVVACETLAEAWLSGKRQNGGADDLKGWTAKQKMLFLDLLATTKRSPHPFAADGKTNESALVVALDAAYGFSTSPNVEIAVRFLRLSLDNKHRPAKAIAAEFLGQHGRGLYVKPVYKALAALDSEFAKGVYAKHKTFYHSVIRNFAVGLLGVEY